jgi:hypothetical protein
MCAYSTHLGWGFYGWDHLPSATGRSIRISSQLVWMMSREEVRAVRLEICESSDTNNGISLFITVLMQRS